MRHVSIDLGTRSYDIRIAAGILGDRRELLPWIAGQQALILTNEIVAPLYLDQIRTALSGKQVIEIILPDGEKTKTLKTLERIFDRMLEVPLDRQATVIALGGGVVGDMAGFAAACYHRGIALIQVPTTLLAQVDSSVGGKTAVNHAVGKNMIGAFHQPRRVIADLATLHTLGARQYTSGLAEVIKYGLINDLAFFNWLEDNMAAILAQDESALAYVVEQSCLNKARIVEQDEREQGARVLLNFGHTFGHAIETATEYNSWLHGEAVGLGMLMATRMSRLQGWITDSEYERVRKLLNLAGLPTEPSADFSSGKLKENMRLDKKVQNGRFRLILLRGIGKAFVADDFDEWAFDQTLSGFAIG